MDNTFDVKQIRKDFPILQTTAYGKPLIYLDSGATTQKPIQVIKAMERYYKEYNANVHRGAHYLSIMATEAHETAREKVRGFIGASNPSSIIFTRNATEGINLIAYAWAMDHLKAGDEIILTIAEHHSNILPWQYVAQKTGAILKYVYLKENERLDMDQYRQMINSKVKLVTIQHMSNVLGIINPVEEIISLAHEKGAKVLVDGAQSVPHMQVDVSKLDCDFLVFSAHKMCGPMGIGVLYVKESMLDQVNPFLFGGEMIAEVEEQSATFAPAPLKFEAGTPNVGGTVGLVSAIDYLESIGMDNVLAHEKMLTSFAIEKMSSLDFIKIHGPLNIENRGGVISFSVKGVHPHDVATILDQDGIAVRSGHHCAQPLMKYLNVPATSRASFYIYNTMEEVEIFIDGLKNIRKWFKYGS